MSRRLIHLSPKRVEPWPLCEICGAEIPLADIAEFRAEAGDRYSLPCCCADCAALESRRDQ